MKTEPAPKVEGKTPWKRLDNAVRHIFTVSKEDVLKAEAQQKQSRQKKRSKTQSYSLEKDLQKSVFYGWAVI